MNKKALSETDIRTKFIAPALVGKNGEKWNVMTQLSALVAEPTSAQPTAAHELLLAAEDQAPYGDGRLRRLTRLS